MERINFQAQPLNFQKQGACWIVCRDEGGISQLRDTVLAVHIQRGLDNELIMILVKSSEVSLLIWLFLSCMTQPGKTKKLLLGQRRLRVSLL